jgi:D-lactate dehydrogenase
VLITSHQGFLTREALNNIAATTLANITAYEKGDELVNVVSV